jgi:thioredoxin reductase (NADPH)
MCCCNTGSSTLIENYAGFRDGVTGEALAAAMIDQATKFQAMLLAPSRVCTITEQDSTHHHYRIFDDAGEHFFAKTVVVACGVQYRRIMAPGVTEYLGRGVSYGSPSLATSYENKQIYVVGANSAGQAVMHLGKCEGCEVHLVVRGEALEDKMSDYLAPDPRDPEHHGASRSRDRARPRDRQAGVRGARGRRWRAPSARRQPVRAHRRVTPHETAMPGVFAAGDIRSGSVKRCASAVGEGSVVVAEIHEYLARQNAEVLV